MRRDNEQDRAPSSRRKTGERGMQTKGADAAPVASPKGKQGPATGFSKLTRQRSAGLQAV